MRPHVWLGPIALWICFVFACHSEPIAPAPVIPPPFRHEAFFESLSADAALFTQRQGEWLEDYGDAPFYGLAFYAYEAPASHALVAARDRALANVTDVDFIEDDLQEVTMSALGLIAYVDATGDRSVLPILDAFIDQLDALVGGIGFYIGPDIVDSWALRTYGSTAISALIALINAEYAVRIGGARGPERAAWARDSAARIAELAFSDTGWALGPDRPGLFLYPNVAMILLDGRLHQLTGDELYRRRALAAYRAIQPLALADARYASPYSAAAMGATTGDYSTLSSHNYLMLALAVLFEITHDDRYVEELDRVLDTLEGKLYGSWCLSDVHTASCSPSCDAGRACVAGACSVDHCGHAVLHHWIDGRPALPTDPEYVCSGCNLQLLYVMWYRRTALTR